MDVQWVTAIATIATVAVAALGILPLFYGLVQTNRSISFTAYYQVFTMMEDAREAWELLESQQSKTMTPADIDKLPKTEKQKLDELARTCDKLGLLVKYKVIPIRFVTDFYSRPLVVSWHRLELYVQEVRQQRGQGGHMRQFEMLAIEAKLYRDKHRPHEETFSITGDQRGSYRRWKGSWKVWSWWRVYVR